MSPQHLQTDAPESAFENGCPWHPALWDIPGTLGDEWDPSWLIFGLWP